MALPPPDLVVFDLAEMRLILTLVLPVSMPNLLLAAARVF